MNTKLYNVHLKQLITEAHYSLTVYFDEDIYTFDDEDALQHVKQRYTSEYYKKLTVDNLADWLSGLPLDIIHMYADIADLFEDNGIKTFDANGEYLTAVTSNYYIDMATVLMSEWSKANV